MTANITKLYSGKDGAMYIGTSTTAAAKVRNWQFQSSLSLLDTTTVGDKLKEYAPGMQSFTGSATLLYYQKSGTAASPVNDASTLVRNLIKSGTAGVTPTTSDDKAVTLQLLLAHGSNARNIKFKCYITSASIGVSVGEVVSANIGFSVTGGLLSGTNL